MGKKIVTLLLVAVISFVLVGCNDSEKRTHYTRDHKEPEKTMLAIQSGDIRNYEQLTKSLENLIRSGIKSEILTVVNYDGVLVEDLERVTDYLINQFPLGVFSVASIVYKPNFIASYCELEVIVSYSKTYSEISNIVPISDKDDLYNRMGVMIEIQDFNNSYEIYLLKLDADMLIRAFDKQWANSGVNAYGIKEVNFGFYPAEYWDRYILDVEFAYTDRMLNVLDKVNETKAKAESIAANCNVSTFDGKINFVLDYLNSVVVYDSQASRVIAETDGRQAKTAIYTATGALLEDRAAQSGIAIAASVLLEELGIENTVICGRENGAPYYWLYINSNGQTMHFDPCAVYADRDGCFLTRSQAETRFTWDNELYNIK